MMFIIYVKDNNDSLPSIEELYSKMTQYKVWSLECVIRHVRRSVVRDISDLIYISSSHEWISML
jgi:hypothetical protein